MLDVCLGDTSLMHPLEWMSSKNYSHGSEAKSPTRAACIAFSNLWMNHRFETLLELVDPFANAK